MRSSVRSDVKRGCRVEAQPSGWSGGWPYRSALRAKPVRNTGKDTAMDLQLAGKRALVTGSSSGIGSEIARMLAAEGIGVVVHGRNVERTQAVVRQIEDAGGRAAIALGDLMTEDGKAAVIDATGRAFGGVDILVNNAGGTSSVAWFETTGEEWTDSYRQNTLPAVALAQAF